MNVTRFAAPLMALTLGACAAAPPPAPPPPSLSPGQAETLALVESNPDAARILASLRNRGVVTVPSDFSRVDLLAGSPGYAWRVGRESLHIHVYRDRQSAAAAADRFVEAANARTAIIDWVGRPHLFECGSALALYLGTAPQALTILNNQCGAPRPLAS